jgi:hypothetical protein
MILSSHRHSNDTHDLLSHARHELDALSNINNEGCMTLFSTITLNLERDVNGMLELARALRGVVVV